MKIATRDDVVFGLVALAVVAFDFAKVHMTHSQELGKVEYGLPAKILRLVGCT